MFKTTGLLTGCFLKKGLAFLKANPFLFNDGVHFRQNQLRS